MKTLRVVVVVMMQIYGMVVQASQDHDHNPNDCSAETVSTTAASGDYGQYGGQRRESSSSSQEQCQQQSRLVSSSQEQCQQQSRLVDSMPVYGKSPDFLDDDEGSSDFSGVMTPSTLSLPESTNVTSDVGSPSSGQNFHFPTAQGDRSLSQMKISNEGLDQLPSTPQSKCQARLSFLEFRPVDSSQQGSQSRVAECTQSQKTISQEDMKALYHSVIVRDPLRTQKLKDVTKDVTYHTTGDFYFCKGSLPDLLPHDIVCLFGSVPPTSDGQQMRWKKIDLRRFEEDSNHECFLMIKGEQNRKVVEDICRSK